MEAAFEVCTSYWYLVEVSKNFALPTFIAQGKANLMEACARLAESAVFEVL